MQMIQQLITITKKKYLTSNEAANCTWLTAVRKSYFILMSVTMLVKQILYVFYYIKQRSRYRD
jgi:hypothetical protein